MTAEIRMLQFDRVALHLVVKGGALDAEEFRRLLFVSVTLRKRLKNGRTLDVVE